MLTSSSIALQKAQAYVNRLVLAGATITSAQRAAVTALAKAIDGIGVAKFAAVYPFLGASAACHALDLLGAYPITWSGSVTHDANGITGDGSSGYGNTGLAANLITNSSAHLAAYMNGTPAGGTSQNFIHASTGSGIDLHGLGWFLTGSREAGGIGVATSGEYAPGSANTNHTGLLAVATNASRNQQYYRNGAAVGSTVAATGNMPTLPLYILAGNQNSTLTGYSTMNMRFASIGAGLSAADMLTFYTAVQAYQTALGRNV